MDTQRGQAGACSLDLGLFRPSKQMPAPTQIWAFWLANFWKSNFLIGQITFMTEMGPTMVAQRRSRDGHDCTRSHWRPSSCLCPLADHALSVGIHF